MTLETIEQNKPPLPPFSLETAHQKVRLAEDGWNSRDYGTYRVGLYARQYLARERMPAHLRIWVVYQLAFRECPLVTRFAPGHRSVYRFLLARCNAQN